MKLEYTLKCGGKEIIGITDIYQLYAEIMRCVSNELSEGKEHIVVEVSVNEWEG